MQLNSEQSHPDDDYLVKKRLSVFQANNLKDQAEILSFQAPVYEKTASEKEELVFQLSNSFLTKSMNIQGILTVAFAMKKIFKAAGEPVIKYGAIGREYYILKEGTARVVIYEKDTDPECDNLEEFVLKTKQLGSGTGFGEIALMYGDKRSASVIAEEDCVLWELDGSVFKNIVMAASVARRNMEFGFIEKVPIMRRLDRYEKFRLLDGLE